MRAIAKTSLEECMFGLSLWHLMILATAAAIVVAFVWIAISVLRKR